MKTETIRVILAIAMCVAVVFIWQAVVAPDYEPTPNVPAQSAQIAPVALTGVDEEAVSVPEAGRQVAPVSSPGVKVIEPRREQLAASAAIKAENGNFILSLDPQSGDIRSAVLKSYGSDEKAAPTFVNLVTNENYAGVSVGSINNYSSTVHKQDNETTVTFTALSDQIRVLKTYKLVDKDPEIKVSVTVENISNDALSVPVTATVGPGLGKGFDMDRAVFIGPIIGNKKDVEDKADNKVKETISLKNPLWGGYTSKYFLFSFLNGGFENAEIEKAGSSAIVKLSRDLTLQSGETAVIDDLSIYVGIKKADKLNSYGIGLQKTIDYGMFWFLAIPMTKILHAAYGVTGNYGVAIIILTIIVKIITLPLTVQSMKSMGKMKDIQPEVMKLRERFKGDPQKINAATMELYRQNKINPLSGCLPLLIQLPIFIALYKALLVAVELKNAPFFGWIHDLSSYDPYYITPVLMGISMFITQKMGPEPTEPIQKKMMTAMPVVFTVLFIKMPSGLVLYWLLSNVLNIVQQYIMNKKRAKEAA